MSGRANVISDKEFRDKNKVLTTSDQQKHGEAHNFYFSSSKDEIISVFGRSRVFLRLCLLFVDFHSFSLGCSRHMGLSPGHSLSTLNTVPKQIPRQKNS